MKRPLHIWNYAIKNQANGAVDIYIDGDIVDAETQAIFKAWFGDDTSTSFKSFRDQLNSVEADIYNVYINSGGGIVTDAMAIHDLLIEVQDKGKTVNTKGRGIIGSAATYILMAGKNAEMSKNSWFMIHNVGGGVYGDVNDIERYARTLRQFNDSSRDFYASATGIRKEDITKMMNEETWMTADQAKDKGFIKQITGETAFKQLISKDNWPYSNMAVLNSYNAAVKPVPSTNEDITSLINQQNEDMKKFFQDLGSTIMNAIKGVKAPENNDHAALMTSIGEAVQKSFENSAEQMEAAVAELVKNSNDITKEGPAKTAFDAAVNTAVSSAVTAAVKTAVDTAAGEMNTKITNLETANAELIEKNKQLESDITNKLGNKQNSNDGGGGTKVVGAFQ